MSEIGDFWWRRFSLLCEESYGSKFQSQRVLEAISLRETLSQFGSILDENMLSQRMYDHWTHPPIFEDSLKFFKENRTPIYILSNIDTFDVKTAIANHHLQVEGVITSEDVKSYKPRPEMFKEALQVSGCSINEVLHIGDSISSDVNGASNVGIKSVWINRNNNVLKTETKPDFIISQLDQLLHFKN